jgi:SAM-dependent methyltransferase
MATSGETTATTVAPGLMGRAVQLGVSVDALAALAAHLRLETEGLDADPEVRRLLADIAGEVTGGVPGAGAADADPVVGMTRAFLRQAADLVEHPGRGGAWDQVDEPLLQGLGRLSMAVVDSFAVAEAELDGLGERMRGDDAAFLDVGTGTGWLAIAVALRHPAVRVVGLDVFEPVLGLARANVTAAALDGRIDLRFQDITALDEEAAYDAIWLPLPFLPRDVVAAALAASRRALRPGGWVLAGSFAGPPGRLPELLIDLRTVRAGGHPWRPDELLPVIAGQGFEAAAELPRRWAAPVRLFVGQRAA